MNPNAPSPGDMATAFITVTSDMIDAFATLSGDTHPVHVDDAWAQQHAFPGRVAHGMLLGALVSRVIGTRLPGVRGLLHSVSLSFRRPCFAGDEVRVDITVDDFIESVSVLRLSVRVERTDGTLLAKGSAQSELRFEDD